MQYLNPGPMRFTMPKVSSQQEWEIKTGTRCGQCLRPRGGRHLCKKTKNAKNPKAKA